MTERMTSSSTIGLSALAISNDPLSVAFPTVPLYGTLPSLNPPMFFGIVEDQVYRSNKFDSSSFTFVSTLQLNTVVYLSSDELTRELTDFFKEKEINVIHLGMKYRSSFQCMTEGLAKEAIEYILDQRRHPIMVMCKSGIHFAGTVIGCLRRLQNWSLTATIDKYRNLASSIKTRFQNEQFIELFDVDLVTLPQHLPDWFIYNQKLMEEERIAIIQNLPYPNASSKDDKNNSPVSKNEPEREQSTLAYQKYYFYVQGPLTSPGVKFSEKKSIIGDDDDD